MGDQTFLQPHTGDALYYGQTISNISRNLSHQFEEPLFATVVCDASTVWKARELLPKKQCPRSVNESMTPTKAHLVVDRPLALDAKHVENTKRRETSKIVMTSMIYPPLLGASLRSKQLHSNANAMRL
jgi:hypothetical protein